MGLAAWTHRVAGSSREQTLISCAIIYIYIYTLGSHARAMAATSLRLVPPDSLVAHLSLCSCSPNSAMTRAQ